MILSHFSLESQNYFKNFLGGIMETARNPYEVLDGLFPALTTCSIKEQVQTIDERLETGNFFYLPGEQNNFTKMNCFENGFYGYCLVQEVYPQSNPKLIQIDEGERGFHYCTFFTHENRTHVLDLNYHLFGRLSIMDNRMTILDLDDKFKSGTKFESLNEVDEAGLIAKIKKLKSEFGVVEFFRDSGQRFIAEDTGIRPYEYFIRIDDNDNLISDFRTREFSLEIPESYRRKTVSPDGRIKGEMGVNKMSSWAQILGTRPLIKWEQEAFGSEGHDWKFTTFRNMRDSNFRDDFENYVFYIARLSQEVEEGKKSLEETFVQNEDILELALEELDQIKDHHEKWLKVQDPSYSKHVTDFMLNRIIVDHIKQDNIFGNAKSLILEFIVNSHQNLTPNHSDKFHTFERDLHKKLVSSIS